MGLEGMLSLLIYSYIYVYTHIMFFRNQKNLCHQSLQKSLDWHLFLMKMMM